MVAIFSNTNPGEEVTVPVEIIGHREIDGVKYITDESEDFMLPEGLLGKNCTFTSIDVNDAPSGLGISVFSFKRDYCG